MAALPLAASLGSWSPLASAAPAASAVANLPVSAVVRRSCAISLGQARNAQPRPLCRSGTIAAALAAGDTGLQYDGPIDPVSVVRLRGKGHLPDTWVVTF
jgi:hypothetical protein